MFRSLHIDPSVMWTFPSWCWEKGTYKMAMKRSVLFTSYTYNYGTPLLSDVHLSVFGSTLESPNKSQPEKAIDYHRCQFIHVFYL